MGSRFKSWWAHASTVARSQKRAGLFLPFYDVFFLAIFAKLVIVNYAEGGHYLVTPLVLEIITDRTWTNNFIVCLFSYFWSHYKTTIILGKLDNLCIKNYTNARQKNGRKTFCHSLGRLRGLYYFLSAMLHTFWQKRPQLFWLTLTTYVYKTIQTLGRK